jgi:hypothetical protein
MRGRLSKQQKLKLGRLLDMLYTPAEIAQELGFGKRQFYRAYIPAGCPHQRAENGHLWINGAEFRTWYLKIYKKTPLTPDQSYCLTCKGPVPIFQPEVRQKGTYVYVVSICPNCGRHLTKALSNKRVNNDQSSK